MYQAAQETKKWPYDFPLSPDFPHSNQRGAITGRLFVNDGAITLANSAYLGLAQPGDAGSWQENTKVVYTFDKFKSIILTLNFLRAINFGPKVMRGATLASKVLEPALTICTRGCQVSSGTTNTMLTLRSDQVYFGIRLMFF